MAIPTTLRRSARLALPAWLDGRMLLAVVILTVSVVGGLLFVSAARETAPVLVVNSTLDPGHVLQESDLAVAQVKVEGRLASMTFAEGELESVIGRPLSGRVHEGAILLRPDVDAGSLIAPGYVGVTVPLDSDAVYAGLRPGDQVAVLVTQDAARPNSQTITLLERTSIYQLTREPGRAVSSSSEAGRDERGVANVTLVVPRSEAERLAHAVINSKVTLAILPPDPASGR